MIENKILHIKHYYWVEKVKKQDCIFSASYCAWNPDLYHLIFNYINIKLYVCKGIIMRNKIKYRDENKENWRQSFCPP